MYSKTFCVAVQGIEGHMVQIEADISDGLPVFSLVGDLSSETKEASVFALHYRIRAFVFLHGELRSIFRLRTSGRMEPGMILPLPWRCYRHTAIFPNQISVIYC